MTRAEAARRNCAFGGRKAAERVRDRQSGWPSMYGTAEERDLKFRELIKAEAQPLGLIGERQ